VLPNHQLPLFIGLPIGYPPSSVVIERFQFSV